MLKGLGCFKFSTSGFSVVVLCHGKENGRDFHAFVAIEPQHYRSFKRRYVPGEFNNFTTYGFELLRGWGAEPQQSVIDYMTTKHGIEFGVSESFLYRVVANVDPVATPLGREYFVNNVAAHV